MKECGYVLKRLYLILRNSSAKLMGVFPHQPIRCAVKSKVQFMVRVAADKHIYLSWAQYSH